VVWRIPGGARERAARAFRDNYPAAAREKGGCGPGGETMLVSSGGRCDTMDAGVAAIQDHLDDVWTSLLAAVREVDDDLLQWSPGPDYNSIAILLRHLAGSERWWIGEVIGGVPAHRVRDSEFIHDRPARAGVLRAVDEARTLSRRVLSGVRAGDLAAPIDVPGARRLSSDGRPDKYWALLHYLEHLGYHRGQILLLRNLGRTAMSRDATSPASAPRRGAAR
jgi:uncharacterized damage-inducible protein DinB